MKIVTSSKFDDHTYSGMVLADDENTKEGYGVTKYVNGAKYQGLFHLNKKHGRGKLFFTDGTVYEGEWINDLYEGFGIYKHPNGCK